MPSKKSDKSNDRQVSKLLVTEPRLFARLADRHLQSGEVKKAAKTLVKGLQQFPDSVSGWLVKGMLHLKLKQAKLARGAFEKALSIDSEIPSAHRHSAELAQQEGDFDGYLGHLRALSTLEPLDDNLQAMLQTAVLRQTAVARGLFSQHQVERMMPGTLRQSLLRANALPPELARRTERFAFPPEPGTESPISTEVEEPKPESLHPAESQPVWKDPKVREQIARMEEADHERVVRVAWADALNNPSETPLVEIDAEQYLDQSERESETPDEKLKSIGPSFKAENSINKPQPRLNIASSPLSPPAVPESKLPLAMQKAMIKPYIPPPKAQERVEPPAYGNIPAESSKQPASIPTQATPPRIDDEWVGSTPSPVAPAMPQSVKPVVPPVQALNLEDDWEGATPSLPAPALKPVPRAGDVIRPDIPQVRRPRLTADIKLPPMRALDANEDEIDSIPPSMVTSRTSSSVTSVLKQSDSLEEPIDTSSFEEPPMQKRQSYVPPKASIEEDVELLSPQVKQPPVAETSPSEIETTPPKSTQTPPETSTPAQKTDVTGDSSSEEPPRILRNDSAIQRLLQAKREPEVTEHTRHTVPSLTRFEMPGVDEDSPPPVSRQPIHHEKPEIVSNAAAILDDESDAAANTPLPQVERRLPLPLPALKPKLPASTQPPTPRQPPPVVNERLEVVDDVQAEPLRQMVVVDAVAPPPPDLVAREEAVRQKLAAIVEEVTGKAPDLESPPLPEQAPEEKGSDYHLKGKIATKTLAELYASQGDWKRSAEVYEVLLQKFPTNEAYRKRLDVLKSKITES